MVEPSKTWWKSRTTKPLPKIKNQPPADLLKVGSQKLTYLLYRKQIIIVSFFPH